MHHNVLHQLDVARPDQWVIRGATDTMTNTEHSTTPVMQGRHLYKDSMTCVPNDFLSVYDVQYFTRSEKQNAFVVLVTQDILHTCSIYIILAKLWVQYSRFSSLLHLIKS